MITQHGIATRRGKQAIPEGGARKCGFQRCPKDNKIIMNVLLLHKKWSG